MSSQANFFFQFTDTATKAGKTGLTVTANIKSVARSNGAVTTISSGASCTEVGDGLYVYNQTVDFINNDYTAVAIPSDTTGLDNADSPSLQSDFSYDSLKPYVLGRLLKVDLNGIADANMAQILGTALTETAGQIAGAFKKFFNIATPAATMDHLVLVNTCSANTDMRGTDNAALAATALSTAQWTSARAGYLDNLNVGGAVASHADVLAFNQSASKHILIQTVGQYERPESGNTVYTVEARTFAAATGAAVNADSSPTVTVTGQTTGDLSANLSASTNPATGVYRWTYTVTSGATTEPIRFEVSATINSATFTLACYTQVVDEVSQTWTATNATQLAAIYNKLPVNNIGDETLLISAIGAPATLTSAYDAAKTAASATALANVQTHGDSTWATATGFSTLTAAGVRTAIGLAIANLDAQLAAIAGSGAPSAGTIAIAVRDVSNATPAAGSLGDKVNVAAAVGASADPWTYALGTYGDGTAGQAMRYMRAFAAGKRVIANESGNRVLHLYDTDGATILRTFTLSPPNGPYTTLLPS